MPAVDSKVVRDFKILTTTKASTVKISWKILPYSAARRAHPQPRLANVVQIF